MNEHNEERKLAATLFPVRGLANTKYRFRVLKVRERIPEDNRRPIRIQRWADYLWRKKLRCPVYPTGRFNWPAFLIPEENSPPTGETIEIKDVPDRIYHIDVTNETVEVSIDEAEGPERELVCRMLERAVTDKLVSKKDTFWRSQWTLFFLLRPENEENDIDVMNAYRGLKFGIVLLEKLGIYLAADIRTRYVGRKPLSEYSEEECKTILKDHIDTESPLEERASFIRDNGNVKIPCRYAGETSKTIDSYKIDSSEETVLGYYNRVYPNIVLSPDDKAVFVKDRAEGAVSLPVPKSRLFPVFTTEYEGVKRCSVKPQMTPKDRMQALESFLSYITDVKYGDTLIRIDKNPLVKERTVFIPPRLEFGNGSILDPFSGGPVPKKSRSEFDSKIVKWSSKKMPALYQNRPYHNESLPNVVLLYPDSIERQTRETFLQDLKGEILLQSGQELNVIRQRMYQSGSRERTGSSLLQVASELKSDSQQFLALIILWDRHYKSVHSELKERISPVLSQCTTEKTVRDICSQRNPQRAKSQLRNLALGVLTEAGVKPWVISDPLYHDLYVGIDTLYGRVVYHYLFGTGARIIERDVGEALTRGHHEQAIKRPELFHRLINPIRSMVKRGFDIKNIILHRDGRWWPSENLALHEALHDLKSKKILSEDIRCAVVEIRKNHKPIRLFTVVGECPQEYFQNPLPGTFLILDKRRALLSTTGRPGAWDIPGGRTAGTLLLEIVEGIGDTNIEEVAEDVYRLTQLNWNAPDIEISLPVTIRWTDEALRETFRSPVQEEEDTDLEKDEEEGAAENLEESL